MLGIYQQQVNLDKMRLLKEFPETTTPAARTYVPDTNQYMKLTNPFTPTSIASGYSSYTSPLMTNPNAKFNMNYWNDVANGRISLLTGRPLYYNIQR